MEIVRTFLIASLSLLLFACGGETCQERMAVSCVITFRADGNTTQSVAIQDTLTIFGLNERNQPLDSALYRRVAGLKQIELPLRLGKEQDVSRYLIRYNKVDKQVLIPDTLTIVHTNTPNFVSIACGCNVLSTLTEMRISTHNNLRVQIINPQTSAQNTPNGSIFF